jgi:hypothetical protein
MLPAITKEHRKALLKGEASPARGRPDERADRQVAHHRLGGQHPRPFQGLIAGCRKFARLIKTRERPWKRAAFPVR